ncbi:MAG: bifunctional oligoribonuclease/PAP phosphatase NrnA [Bacillota bacterium]|nr:bifunctional oligoribonuclease/PAP phosphatase NrnA [Bacillota bacterium]
MKIHDEVGNIFRKGGEFLITTHLNPDGDAVGSLLGLGLALKKLDKKVELISPHPLSESYQFLPGSELIQLPCNLKKIHFEIAVVLDCTELNRTGKDLEDILKKCKTVINIDHHISNTGFGSINVVDPGAAATGELVFEILVGMGVQITPDIATNLYFALVTDTGFFQYQNTTPRCHRTGASLLEYGATQRKIHQFLNENRSLTSIHLLGKSLGTLSVSESGLVAWMTVSQQFLREVGGKIEDCEGFINYPKSLAGVEVGILFKELENNEIKVGFRSKKFLDVNQLAACFGGGGHERAAGCTVRGHLKEVERKVIQATEQFLTRGGGGN